MAKPAHLHAVDVTTSNGVVTARIVGPAVEEHRGKAIIETVGRAIDDAADSLRALVLDFGDVTVLITCVANPDNRIGNHSSNTLIDSLP